MLMSPTHPTDDRYGVQSNANFSIEACVIGECGGSGRGGGVLTRAGVTQLRGTNGVNENKVTLDPDPDPDPGPGPGPSPGPGPGPDPDPSRTASTRAGCG